MSGKRRQIIQIYLITLFIAFIFGIIMITYGAIITR